MLADIEEGEAKLSCEDSGDEGGDGVVVEGKDGPEAGQGGGGVSAEQGVGVGDEEVPADEGQPDRQEGVAANTYGGDSSGGAGEGESEGDGEWEWGGEGRGWGG